MYITTEHGFISVVADCMTPDRVIVRAHRGDHLRALFPDLPWGSIEQMGHLYRGEAFSADDYHYRVFITRDQLREMMLRQVDELQIGTFRERIADPEYYDACNRARREMYRMDRSVSYYWKMLDGE